MIKILILRGPSTDEGTFGTLSIPSSGNMWHTLELPWRDNINRKSCINLGVYTAKLLWSPHFKKSLYRLEDAHGRSEILIHAANFGGCIDMGYNSELLGCIAVGKSIGPLRTSMRGKMQQALRHSGQALQEFMEAVAGADLEIEITGT